VGEFEKMTSKNEFELRLAIKQYNTFKFYIVKEYVEHLSEIFDDITTTNLDIEVLHFKFEVGMLIQIIQPEFKKLDILNFQELNLSITKDTLNTGSLVRLKNEDFFIVYKNTIHGNILKNDESVIPLDEFNLELNHKHTDGFTIVELHESENLFDFHQFEKYNIMWKRKSIEPDVKQVYTVKNLGIEDYVRKLMKNKI